MFETDYACTVCASSFRTPDDLADHLDRVHKPETQTDSLQRALSRLLRFQEVDTPEMWARDLPDVDTHDLRERDARLVALRARGAYGILERRKPILWQTRHELLAVAEWSAKAAEYHAERARLARESAELLHMVLDVLDGGGT